MRQASPPSNPKPRPESIKSTNNPPPSAALASHPDGIPLDSSEQEHDTLIRRYHLINDAYYNLSDATRRTHYDAQRRYSALSTQEAGAFEEAEEISQQPGGTGEANGDDDQQLREDAQFKDVFEGEMRENNMAEDGTNMPKTAFWSLIGGVTGGTLAFLITGPPGIPAGMVIGSTAGKIRDARGKSVYEVYKVSGYIVALCNVTCANEWCLSSCWTMKGGRICFTSCKGTYLALLLESECWHTDRMVDDTEDMRLPSLCGRNLSTPNVFPNVVISYNQ